MSWKNLIEKSDYSGTRYIQSKLKNRGSTGRKFAEVLIKVKLELAMEIISISLQISAAAGLLAIPGIGILGWVFIEKWGMG